jgi:2-haloalkanoic acid dehalogenase type II
VTGDIEAVAFDCYGTLIDFTDAAFARAYGVICAEQGLDVSGEAFYDKWMEVWRRLVRGESAAETADMPDGAAVADIPGPLSEAEVVPEHPRHHTPSAGRHRGLDGPAPEFRTYRQEWTEHFALCFEELGLEGDAEAAHERLRELLAQGQAYPDARRTVETIARRLPTALLSNADDDFLYPCLRRNGLTFPVVVTSESAGAYKPHISIFRKLSQGIGLQASKIVYVGDSRLADVTGAKHAGLQAAWMNRNGTTSEWSAAGRELLEPDYEISTLDDLLGILGLA